MLSGPATQKFLKKGLGTRSFPCHYQIMEEPNIEPQNPHETGPEIPEELEALTIGFGEDGTFGIKVNGKVAENLFAKTEVTEKPSEKQEKTLLHKGQLVVMAVTKPSKATGAVTAFEKYPGMYYVSVDGHPRYEVVFEHGEGENKHSHNFYSNHFLGERAMSALAMGIEISITDHLFGAVSKANVI
jgi:hypothetical protein